MCVDFASAAMVAGGKLRMLLVVVGGLMIRLSGLRKEGRSWGVGMVLNVLSNERGNVTWVEMGGFNRVASLCCLEYCMCGVTHSASRAVALVVSLDTAEMPEVPTGITLVRLGGLPNRLCVHCFSIRSSRMSFMTLKTFQDEVK